MAKVANTGPFKNFPGWNPVEKRKNYGQNQQASNMEPFGGNLWHCALLWRHCSVDNETKIEKCSQLTDMQFTVRNQISQNEADQKKLV